MSLKDLIGQVEQVAGETADLGTKYLDEFNEALPTLHALGFSVRDFIVGMGLIPEVTGTLIGCIDDIDPQHGPRRRRRRGARLRHLRNGQES